MSKKQPHKKEKSRLHARNKNRERYDLDALMVGTPALKSHVKPNKYGDDSVNFSNPETVRLLNKALLKNGYGIDFWDFPTNNLTPPIPGRADYVHYLADLLQESNYGRLPEGQRITCYDIGVGASCIYPLLGTKEYNWNFIGSDIDPKSVASSQEITVKNKLENSITIKLQENARDVFFGVFDKSQQFDVSMCNPPFHASISEAQAGTKRKIKNLTGKETTKADLNFAGVSNELITEGGENKFIKNMIRESKLYSKNCYWFTTLVSKQSNVRGIKNALKTSGAVEIKVIPMGTGNKSTRIIAWTFLTKEEQNSWKKSRWK